MYIMYVYLLSICMFLFPSSGIYVTFSVSTLMVYKYCVLLLYCASEPIRLCDVWQPLELLSVGREH